MQRQRTRRPSRRGTRGPDACLAILRNTRHATAAGTATFRVPSIRERGIRYPRALRYSLSIDLRPLTSMSTSASDSPFTRLPQEIVLQILTIAVYANRQVARTACLVASWARELAMPALYSSAPLTSPRRFNRLCVALGLAEAGAGVWLYRDFRERASGHHDSLSEKEKARLAKRERAKWVKSLWIPPSGGVAMDRAEALFTVCDNLEHVAIPSRCIPELLKAQYFISQDPDALRGDYCSRISHLTINDSLGRWDWERIAGIDPHAVDFSKYLTHITLLETQDQINLPLDELSNLSHLALPFPTDSSIADISDIPDEIVNSAGNLAPTFVFAATFLVHPSLQILVLHQMASKSTTSRSIFASPRFVRITPVLSFRAHMHDMRLHLLVLPDDFDARDCWARETDGEGGIWELAQEAVSLTIKECVAVGESS